MLRFNSILIAIVCLLPTLGEASGEKAGDMVVGEARVVSACSNCPKTPIVCAAAADEVTKRKLTARNSIGSVKTIFAGETVNLGGYAIRCGAQTAENLEFYVEYGCAAQMDLKLQRKVLSVDEFDGYYISKVTERELEQVCRKQGRELFFAPLAGLPKIVRSTGEVKTFGRFY